MCYQSYDDKKKNKKKTKKIIIKEKVAVIMQVTAGHGASLGLRSLEEDGELGRGMVHLGTRKGPYLSR